MTLAQIAQAYRAQQSSNTVQAAEPELPLLAKFERAKDAAIRQRQDLATYRELLKAQRLADGYKY
jgi:hypothetical protein